MLVHASAKNIRMSPDKIRLVVNEIRRLKPSKSVEVLAIINKKAAMPLKKVIQSAIANSKNNYGLDEASLVFKEIQVNKGIVFKRYQPIARGRVHPILKRTSHIMVILEGEKSKKVSEVSKIAEEKTKKETNGGYDGSKS